MLTIGPVFLLAAGEVVSHTSNENKPHNGESRYYSEQNYTKSVLSTKPDCDGVAGNSDDFADMRSAKSDTSMASFTAVLALINPYSGNQSDLPESTR